MACGQKSPRVRFHSTSKDNKGKYRDQLWRKNIINKRKVWPVHTRTWLLATSGDQVILPFPTRDRNPFAISLGASQNPWTLCCCIPTSSFSSILLVSDSSLQEIEFCTMKGLACISAHGWNQKSNLPEPGLILWLLSSVNASVVAFPLLVLTCTSYSEPGTSPPASCCVCWHLPQSLPRVLNHESPLLPNSNNGKEY